MRKPAVQVLLHNRKQRKPLKSASKAKSLTSRTTTKCMLTSMIQALFRMYLSLKNMEHPERCRKLRRALHIWFCLQKEPWSLPRARAGGLACAVPLSILQLPPVATCVTYQDRLVFLLWTRSLPRRSFLKVGHARPAHW